jgi:hypothetical protein
LFAVRPKLTENKTGHTNKTGVAFCFVRRIQMLTDGFFKRPFKQSVSLY